MKRACLLAACATMVLLGHAAACGGQQVEPPDAAPDATLDGEVTDADVGQCCNVKTGQTSGDACAGILPDGWSNGTAYPCAAPKVCRLSQTVGGYECCPPNDANDYCP